ncbi:hypothetical protein HDG70_001373 [Carboxydothermus ferrireducens DSM 11255]|uniref:Transmembrane protein n=1 Tax=Carboxydothermus ferrireducens DSM 11255 TaxID=1119529 RepID=A0ABX2RC66_9THEO|nr:hypothetical protein [Carboxydothermus ferrireducens DSM 11255]
MSMNGSNQWFLFFILILLIFGLNDHDDEHETCTTAEKEVV